MLSCRRVERCCLSSRLTVDGGVTLLDSAEMYPVPQRAETQARLPCRRRADVRRHADVLLSPAQGRSEELLGRWLRESGARSRVVVATKVAGPAAMTWLRSGPLRLDAASIRTATEASLQRLGIECIDLLQLHWPDRCA